MATIRDQIILYLQDHPEGVDDDMLAQALALKQRQQANSRCRELEREGFVFRRVVNGKIRNFWVDSKQVPLKQTEGPKKATLNSDLGRTKNWFWEGNVQAQVVKYLVAQQFLIRSVADTASHQHGVDIIAERDGRQLWISVKGYPQGTEKTQPTTQAGHWFKNVVFDMLAYRGENKSIKLGIALPDFPRYRSLAARIAWFKAVADFVYFWVQENGEVVVG